MVHNLCYAEDGTTQLEGITKAILLDASVA
jgi:hypothetical protein